MAKSAVLRAVQCAVVLGPIKAKPSVAAEEAASLDTTCARRRQHSAVGARESLRRGRTREMTFEGRSIQILCQSALSRLHSALRLENGARESRVPVTFSLRSGASHVSGLFARRT